MLFRWLLPIMSKVGVLALVGYLGWLAWVNLGPRKPEIGPARKELADKVIAQITEDIRTNRGNSRNAAILQFVSDPSDYFTDTLRSVIEQNGILDLHDRTVMEKARALLNLRQPSVANTDAAVAEGRALGVQCVLCGVIHAFESYSGEARIDVDVYLVDVATGHPIFAKRYATDTARASAVTAAIQDVARSFPLFRRLLGWLVAVLLLPVFTIAFIRAMVRKGSNKANAFVLSVYTVVDALLAWLLVGAALNSWFSVVIFIAAVVAALLYNVRVMTLALRLEEA